MPGKANLSIPEFTWGDIREQDICNCLIGYNSTSPTASIFDSFHHVSFFIGMNYISYFRIFLVTIQLLSIAPSKVTYFLFIHCSVKNILDSLKILGFFNLLIKF